MAHRGEYGHSVNSLNSAAEQTKKVTVLKYREISLIVNYQILFTVSRNTWNIFFVRTIYDLDMTHLRDLIGHSCVPKV
jgi:hypothetical protein